MGYVIMTPKIKRSNRSIYTHEQLLSAVAAVRNEISQREASKTFNVPRTTLFDKLQRRTPMTRKIGRDPYLTKGKEKQILE